jgi:hypothetical protein
MILAIIRSYMGSFGRAVMDFYVANSFPINMVILGYALLVYASQQNYLFVLHKIAADLDLIKEKKGKGVLLRKMNKSDHLKISWDQLRKKVWFPLIAAPGKWTFRLCTTNYFLEEFTVEKINSYIDKSKNKKR